MRYSEYLRGTACRMAAKLGLARLKTDETGATAIEFAIVATPFFMFIFGLIGISMYFFVMTSLDKGVDKQSRLIRTGQANSNNNIHNHPMTVDDFKNDVCATAGTWIKCPSVQVFVQHFPDWTSVQPQACLSGSGQIVTNNANGSDAIAAYSGTASDVVLVTTCYKWDFIKGIPYIKLGNMSDNSMMMQSTTAFRTEPYTPPSGP